MHQRRFPDTPDGPGDLSPDDQAQVGRILNDQTSDDQILGGRTIGLLGGSFNPAHAGHRQIAEEALRRLNLDAVWWVVSPQNPLKSSSDMAPFAVRLARARIMAQHPRMRVCDLEMKFGTHRTADTLDQFHRRYPKDRFIWLMGADNLGQISSWAKWQQIFNTTPVAVFARAPYNLRVLAGVAARRFARFRIKPQKGTARRLGFAKAPAWVFFHIRTNPASASAIRAWKQARR
ncbi:MAG: nicotinate-nucleotide adenylyltransferase [Alphaproteobacteria bacterium]